VSVDFSLTQSPLSHYGPGIDSASNRNKYQEHFLGVKAAGAKADNVPQSCAVVTKSGKLNFLEHSGPLRACNGTALPLPLRPINGSFDCTRCFIYDAGRDKVAVLSSTRASISGVRNFRE